jgi:hypothetical protein
MEKMIYLFKHIPDDPDFIFKVDCDILINFTSPIESFKELINKEDIIMEASGFSFCDDYSRPVDEVTTWYFEDEKKYSKDEFNQLLTMAINQYFLLYPEGKEEINNILNLAKQEKK